MLVYLQFDEDVSPTAKEWISIVEETRSTESKSFIYLSGIMASESDDVLEVGLKKISAYKLAEERLDYLDEQIHYTDYGTCQRSALGIERDL